MGKLSYFSLLVFAGLLLASCGNKPAGEKAETSEAAVASQPTAQQLSVSPGTGSITWTGSKPTGQHTGTIQISDGSVSLEDGMIKAGNFVIDMKSIVDTDLEAGNGKEKLEGHLKSADFFDVDQFPQATFEVTNVKSLEGDPEASHLVYGNLTMKGISKQIGFKAKVESSESGISVTTPPFTIDRTEWEVKYGSGKFFDDLKDKVIHDEIGLQITFKAA